MPSSYTTTLSDAQQPTLGNGVEDEVSYSIPDDTNNGDYRIQIRETGQTAWDGTATGFAEDIKASDGDTSGTIDGIFTGREDGEEYEVRARTETDDVTGAWTDPVSITTKFSGASDLTLTVVSSTELRADWVDNADNEDGFRVFVAEEKDRRADTGYTAFEEVADLAPNTETYDLTGLEKNTGYKAYIQAYTEHTTADSATVTESTGPDLTLQQSLTLGESTNRIQLGPGEIVAKDLAKVHTGVGTARVSVPELDVLMPGVQRHDRVNYYVNGNAVWTGYAVGFQGDELTGQWELRIDGVGLRLEETRPDYQSLGGPVVYTNTRLDSAIRDYWARTPFNATVTDQVPELVAENEELQSADTDTEWGNVLSLADTDPFVIRDGNLELAQSNYLSEAEDPTSSSGVLVTDPPDFSAGNGLEWDGNGDVATWEFTTEYTIPESAVAFYVRDEGTDMPEITYRLDGQTVDTLPESASGLALSWENVADGPYGGDGWTGGDLSPGTYELEIEATSAPSASGGFYDVDVVCLLDTRFNYFFDNDNGGSSGYLDGPELYPDAADALFNSVTTAYNITSATVTTTFNDTSGSQAIAVSNDNGANFLESTNTSTDTFNFTTSGREALTRFTLSRYGSRTGATPLQGHLGQVVQDYTLAVDLNDLVVIDRLELSREHFANLKTLHDYGDFLWTIEHNDSDIGNLTVRSYMRGQETRTAPAAFSDVENIQPEVAAENYFNSIYLEGAKQDDGTRPTAEVKDVPADEREIPAGVLRDQNISTEAGAQFRANAILQSVLDNNALRGTISTYPVYVQPGYSYAVNFGQGEDPKTLESVSIRESAGDVQATYEFVTREQLAETISSLKREGRDLGNQV